ncbi:hypothetical protein FBU30_001436 [Linnemannia zychae]|nr:hypothetical protein FBU30_001436 [Linnemannia zychae]
MANHRQLPSPRSRMISSFLVATFFFGLISSSLATPLPPIHSTGDSLTIAPQNAGHRRTLLWLEKRAPPDVISKPSPKGTPEGGGGSTVTTDPPAQTTTTPDPPVTTTTTTTTTTKDPPVTTSTTPVVTTTTTTDPPATTTTTTTSEDPETSTTSSSRSRQSHAPTNHPTGGGSKGPSGAPTVTSTATPTSTPSKTEDSSKPPILPIVLGSVLGAGVLIGAAVFFFIRFRKHKRFDSKRPLSFLALSVDDPTGSESASARALGTDALYDTNRPITSQPSLRYTPPVMSSIKRYSYQSSEHSGATGGQFAQWSQDDENAALVGEPSRQQHLMIAEQGEDGYPARFHDDGVYPHDHGYMADQDQAFVASSMMPLAANDPRHTRYSHQVQQRQQQQQQQQPGTLEIRNVSHHHPETSSAVSQHSVPLQVLNSEAEQGQETPRSRPLSVHSNAASVLSVKNPSAQAEDTSNAGGVERMGSTSSKKSKLGAIESEKLDFL